MAPEERSEILSVLDATRREMHAAVEGLADDEASASPAPGRWSVLECIEHVTIVEQRFMSRLQNAERVDSPSIDKEREAALLERVADRTQRAQAPELVRPSGRFTNLPEALEAFDAVRSETMRVAEARHADLHSLAESHPRFGPLNGYEFVLIVAGHSRRHAAQIHEIRAALASL
jgi:DinB superfamily